MPDTPTTTRTVTVTIQTWEGSYPDPGALAQAVTSSLTRKGHGPLHAIEVSATETTDDKAERIYVEKCHQYVLDPAFDGHVLGYLRSMADEWAEQANNHSNELVAACAAAKRDAYLDAVRVLADADDAAYRFATEATR